MAEAELKVVLVGDDAEQQQAFNAPSSAPAQDATTDAPYDTQRAEYESVDPHGEVDDLSLSDLAELLGERHDDSLSPDELRALAKQLQGEQIAEPAEPEQAQPESSSLDDLMQLLADSIRSQQKSAPVTPSPTASVENATESQFANTVGADPSPQKDEPGNNLDGLMAMLQSHPMATPATAKPATTEQFADVFRAPRTLEDSLDDLIDKIDEWIFAFDGTGTGTPAPSEDSEPAPGKPAQNKVQTNVFERSVQKVLKSLGIEKTRMGRTIRSVSHSASKSVSNLVGRNSLVRRASKAARSVGRSKTARRMRARARLARRRIAQSRVGRAAGSVAKSVARSRVGQAVGRVATSAARGLAAVGGSGTAGAAGGTAAAGTAAGTAAAVALPVAAVAAAAIAFAYSVKKLSDAANGVATDLEDLSPAISAARSQFGARRELQRLDRAQRTGTQLAQLDQARFRIQESMYEVQTKILELLLKGAPILEAVLDAVNYGVRGADLMVAAIENLRAQISIDPNDDGPAQERFDESLRQLNQAFAEIWQSNPTSVRDPWLDQLLQVEPPPAPVHHAPNHAGGFHGNH